jgi:hypothetical protein
MSNFYLTFGYGQCDPHPTFPDASVDGWVCIKAETDAEARVAAVHVFGQKWSMLYEESDFDRSYHPLGELAMFWAKDVPADPVVCECQEDGPPGYVEDPTACGDPDHCAGWTTCPRCRGVGWRENER